MTATNQKQLGSTLWKIADDLRGAMNADDTLELWKRQSV
jgi:type I restriction enzyme M protein